MAPKGKSVSTDAGPSNPKRARNNKAPAASSTILPSSRFVNTKCYERYLESRDNDFVVEKTVSQPIDHEYRLTEAFANIDWEQLLHLEGTFYPELVKEFFANIEGNSPRKMIESRVKGVKITITNDLLRSQFRIANHGIPFAPSQAGAMNSDVGYNPLDAMQYFGLQGHELMTKNLGQPHIRARLLMYLYSFNVMPRASGYNKIRNADLYFAYRMLAGLGRCEGIPLSSIIIKQLWSAALSNNQDKAFIFPILLSNIFEHFGVSFRGEEERETHAVLDDSVMIHLRYFQPPHGGPWRCVERFHRVVPEENEEEMMEGGEAQGGEPEEHHEEAAHVPQAGTHYDMDYLTEQFGQIHTELAVHRRDLRDQRRAIEGMGSHLWNMNYYCQELGRHFSIPPPPPYDPHFYFPPQGDGNEGDE
ncbi:unnamed protein product [Cuscuta epithymum]|uniref:Putative plant transposon protein domain-containing protein n=1 Tax=Cuscuta epithymum TaxID=186058 RepID=A0AAV0DDG5_9ASTE|nr:unnamed protein product [Cuscuta epithymum]